LLKDKAREVKPLLESVSRAMQGKVDLMIFGESRVAQSCQIPEVRNKYREFGLPERHGVFAEVGAFNGGSNTSFLADQGWHGLYIEPIK
jgi:hypothetical protein